MLEWLFGKKEQKKDLRRFVSLQLKTGSVYIVEAFYSQSGWMAEWIKSQGQWSYLNEDGTTGGCDLVKSWRKYSGWPEETEKVND